MTSQPKHQLMDLDLENVEADPNQVRKHFDEEAIEQLAASLRTNGQHVPILAFSVPDRGTYVVLDGERRLRAARLAKLATIRAEVLPYRPDHQELTLSRLTIDSQRLGLNPTEQAAGFQEVMDANGWSANELAKHIHVSHTTITRAVSLLSLPGDLQDLVRTKALATNIAREIARVGDPEIRATVWAKVKDERLGQSATARLVSRLVTPAVKGKTRGPKPAKKWAFKNLGGYNATVSVKAVKLVSIKKGSTTQDVLTALRQLAERFEAEVAKADAPVEVRQPSEFVAESSAQPAVHQ